MEKAELRRFIRTTRRPIDSTKLAEWSSVISERLLSHPKVQSAKTILLYHSLPDEVQTTQLLTVLHSMNKLILLPKIIGDGIMELRVYTGENSLSKGQYGIMEPIGEVFSDYENIDVAIIPGMAFDKKGHRLGRGKGYYDRLLPQLHNTYTIGICFPFQLLDSVPVTSHDIPVDEVITYSRQICSLY